MRPNPSEIHRRGARKVRVMLDRKNNLNGINLLAVCLCVQLFIMLWRAPAADLASDSLRSVGVSADEPSFTLICGAVYASVMVLSVFFPMTVFFRMRGRSKSEYLSLNPTLPVHSAYALIFCVAFSAMILFFMNAYRYAVPDGFAVRADMPGDAAGTVVRFVELVLIPAFALEPFFRGVALRELMPFGRTFAIAASSFMGAIAEDCFSDALFALCVGFVCGYFVMCTNSLWIGIFMRLSAGITYFIYGFLLSSGISVRYSAAMFIATSVLFLSGIFCCLRIDEQLRMDNISPMQTERGTVGNRAFVSCLRAPCMLAYYIAAVLMWI